MRRIYRLMIVFFITTLLLTSCTMYDSSPFRKDYNYRYIGQDDEGKELYVYIPSIRKAKESEDMKVVLDWTEPWFKNREQDGLKGDIPHQTIIKNKTTISKSVEYSHEWAFSACFKQVEMGYTNSSTNTVTLEKEITIDKIYGPVMVKSGYKCRLVSYLKSNIQEGCFIGDSYQKKRLLLGHYWRKVEEEIRFGYWKSCAENISFEFETKRLNPEE